MSDKTKHILKQIAALAVFIGVLYLLTMLPTMRKLYAPLTSEKRVACSSEDGNANEYMARTAKDIALGRNADDGVKVNLTGMLSYSTAAESFYVRDGVFSIPVDLSNCIHTEIYKEKGSETLMFARGVVSRKDGDVQILADGIKESVPTWAQYLFTIIVFSWIVLSVFALTGLLIGLRKLLVWFSVIIGLRQAAMEDAPKPEMPPEERNKKQAGFSVVCAICAPFLWYINPFMGVAWQVLGVFSGWRGLRSVKRTVAIVGLALCAAELFVIPIAFAAWGMFSKPPMPNFANLLVEDSWKKAADAPVLQPKPYVNEKLGFSMRLPWGWTVNEKTENNAGLLVSAPKADPVSNNEKHTSYAASIIVDTGTASVKDEVEYLKTHPADWMKAPGVYEEGSITHDGQVVGTSLGITYTSDEGLMLRNFRLVSTGTKGGFYSVSAFMLDSARSLHEKELKESFATFLPAFDFDMFYSELTKASAELSPCIQKLFATQEPSAFEQQLAACKKISDASSAIADAFGKKYDNAEILAAKADVGINGMFMSFFTSLLDIGRNEKTYSKEEKKQKEMVALGFLDQVITGYEELGKQYADTAYVARGYPQGVAPIKDGIVALRDGLKKSTEADTKP